MMYFDTSSYPTSGVDIFLAGGLGGGFGQASTLQRSATDPPGFRLWEKRGLGKITRLI
jgi:hypothetical protein